MKSNVTAILVTFATIGGTACPTMAREFVITAPAFDGLHDGVTAIDLSSIRTIKGQLVEAASVFVAARPFTLAIGSRETVEVDEVREVREYQCESGATRLVHVYSYRRGALVYHHDFSAYSEFIPAGEDVGMRDACGPIDQARERYSDLQKIKGRMARDQAK